MYASKARQQRQDAERNERNDGDEDDALLVGSKTDSTSDDGRRRGRSSSGERRREVGGVSLSGSKQGGNGGDGGGEDGEDGTLYPPHSSGLPYIYDVDCPPELSRSMLGITWEQKSVHYAHKEQIHGCAIHPTLPYVATASWDITCKIFDIKKNQLITTLEGQHEKGLYAVEFSPLDANIIGTVSSDTTCQIWEVNTGRHLVSCKGHTDEVNGMAFHPHQKSVVASTFLNDFVLHPTI